MGLLNELYYNDFPKRRMIRFGLVDLHTANNEEKYKYVNY